MKLLFPAVFALFMVIGFSSCTSARSQIMRDGRSGYTVDCSGRYTSWDNCYSRAESLCGRKSYEVISREKEAGVHETRRMLKIVCTAD